MDKKDASNAPQYRTLEADLGAKKTAENKGVHGVESLQVASPRKRRLEFVVVNSVTVKVTDGRQIKTWDGRTGHYHAPRAVAWLIAVGGGKWIVRYKNTASKPMKLPKARS